MRQANFIIFMIIECNDELFFDLFHTLYGHNLSLPVSGRIVEVVTAVNGDLRVSEDALVDGWYAGYTWSYAYCPMCGKLLGWHFSKSSDPAVGKLQCFNDSNGNHSHLVCFQE
jgi:hypothetical protein